MPVLDKLPVASITFIAGIVVLVFAYISNDIAFDQMWQYLLGLGASTGAIGYVRNQAGKGIN